MPPGVTLRRGGNLSAGPDGTKAVTVATGFDDFVVARSPRLLRTSFLLTHDWGLAEDLLQTALARAGEAWHRIEGDPEPYVRRILAKAYASRWRRRWTGEPAEARPDGDERDRVWRALRRLPRRQRTVVVLCYYEGLSEAAIAEVLGCRPATVQSQASRAAAELRLEGVPR